MDVGDTVSLRVATSGGPRELIGTLLARTAETLTIRRRDGELDTVRVSDVRHGRVVPPGPAATVEAGELARVAAQGWRALESEPLGDWVLRASDGFTGRGNSVLPVGDPGRPLDDALDAVEAWYAARELAPKVQLPDRGVAPDLVPLLDGRGWETSAVTQVMTAEL